MYHGMREEMKTEDGETKRENEKKQMKVRSRGLEELRNQQVAKASARMFLLCKHINLFVRKEKEISNALREREGRNPNLRKSDNFESANCM
jgi:hypothetical protein